ncbi:MAG: lytic transglycosylase domain-containing protein [Deltaproteobacteria bacterium]|jgi:hypothetical protein|nr:lytic transglycosylase domain-containing protein [Deltaproteobacteria bacterium]
MKFSCAKLAFIVALLLTVSAGCRTLEDPTAGGPREGRAPSLWFLGQPGGQRIDYRLPAAVSLCGEPLPLDRPAVRERLESEFLLAVNHPAQVELWRRRALRYFPLIEKTLRQAGLPDDLKYLAVAESDLRPTVFSPAGAAGLWQFIPSTARRFGLKVDKQQDQRMLPEPLLAIGLRYLSALRDRFGSWALAMAAYNSGETRVDGAVKRQGSSDYFELNLPNETERYVYRIAAVKIIFDHAAAMGFTGQPAPGLYAPPAFRETELTFAEPKMWKQLAEETRCDYKILRLLNPHLSGLSPLQGGPFKIRLPEGA